METVGLLGWFSLRNWISHVDNVKCWLGQQSSGFPLWLRCLPIQLIDYNDWIDWELLWIPLLLMDPHSGWLKGPHRMRWAQKGNISSVKASKWDPWRHWRAHSITFGLLIKKSQNETTFKGLRAWFFLSQIRMIKTSPICISPGNTLSPLTRDRLEFPLSWCWLSLGISQVFKLNSSMNFLYVNGIL